jgi:hypothetical protein
LKRGTPPIQSGSPVNWATATTGDSERLDGMDSMGAANVHLYIACEFTAGASAWPHATAMTGAFGVGLYPHPPETARRDRQDSVTSRRRLDRS